MQKQDGNVIDTTELDKNIQEKQETEQLIAELEKKLA